MVGVMHSINLTCKCFGLEMTRSKNLKGKFNYGPKIEKNNQEYFRYTCIYRVNK